MRLIKRFLTEVLLSSTDSHCACKQEEVTIVSLSVCQGGPVGLSCASMPELSIGPLQRFTSTQELEFFYLFFYNTVLFESKVWTFIFKKTKNQKNNDNDEKILLKMQPKLVWIFKGVSKRLGEVFSIFDGLADRFNLKVIFAELPFV